MPGTALATMELPRAFVTASEMGETDAYGWGCNKWLLAHPDAPEAAQGAYVGLVGENIDIASDLV